jgi:hypothetical protein
MKYPVLRRLRPAVFVHESRDVNRLQLGNEQVAGRLRELLAVPDVVAVGLLASVELGPGEKRLDHVSHPRRGGFGSTGSYGCELMELLLGQRPVLPAMDEAGLTTSEGHHPPAGVLAEPDLVGLSHTKPPVVE